MNYDVGSRCVEPFKIVIKHNINIECYIVTDKNTLKSTLMIIKKNLNYVS